MIFGIMRCMVMHDLGDRLPALVARIVASYHGDPRIQHIDRRYLPSKQAILSICELLLELTFPGYFGRKGLTSHNIGYHVGELLPQLWELLVDQITQCLTHERVGAGLPAETSLASYRPAGFAPPDDCRADAVQLATEFIERIPEVRALLADDVQAAYDGDPAATTFAEVILSYPSLIAITLHRYAHLLYRMHVPMMPRIISERAHELTAIDIHPGAQIGRHFFIDHGTGVVIGETTQIGDHVKIYQGVTLGALSFPKDARGRIIRGQKRHPTVGNYVTIYANAIVLGGDTVLGDGCIIGGSVFLTQSVAPGHQVSISPPVLKVRPPRGIPGPQPPGASSGSESGGPSVDGP